MAFETLGPYRLVKPLPVRSLSCKFFSATLEAEAGAPANEGSPTFLAKVLPLGRSPEEQVRKAQFEHELRLLDTFNHPGIPTLHARGESPDAYLWGVMDLVPGVDLGRFLGHDQGAPRSLPKEIAVYIVAQVVDALRYVHEAEVLSEQGAGQSLDLLHRDLCPENILVSDDGDVVLIDFGSARSRWLAPEHDMPQAGHRAYMAPERITGTQVATVQSDLFGVALVLWEMLRGERCIKADSELRAMDEIVRFDIGHPSRRVPGLSAKLGEVLRRNLDRDPARRYESAYQVLAKLAQSPEAQEAEAARVELGRMVRAVTRS